MADLFDQYHVWLGIPPEEQLPNHCRLLGILLFEKRLATIEHAADRQFGQVLHVWATDACKGQSHPPAIAPLQIARSPFSDMPRCDSFSLSGGRFDSTGALPCRVFSDTISTWESPYIRRHAYPAHERPICHNPETFFQTDAQTRFPQRRNSTS